MAQGPMTCIQICWRPTERPRKLALGAERRKKEKQQQHFRIGCGELYLPRCATAWRLGGDRSGAEFSARWQRFIVQQTTTTTTTDYLAHASAGAWAQHPTRMWFGASRMRLRVKWRQHCCCISCQATRQQTLRCTHHHRR